MSTVPSPFTQVSEPNVPARRRANSIILFTPRMRAFGILMALVTVAPELLPVNPMPVPLFVLYCLMKIGSFFSLGLIAPFAIRSLNGIGVGMIISFLSALLIEVSQGFLHRGHSFHWYELVGKLSLIAFGFAFALDCRYERKLSAGPLQIDFLIEN